MPMHHDAVMHVILQAYARAITSGGGRGPGWGGALLYTFIPTDQVFTF
jgi:hypothetical protein